LAQNRNLARPQAPPPPQTPTLPQAVLESSFAAPFIVPVNASNIIDTDLTGVFTTKTRIHKEKS
jgi:hypothetical protein